jgi:PAS domain S-box-containing protein
VRTDTSAQGVGNGTRAPGIQRYLVALLGVLTAVPVLLLGHGHATRVAESDRRRHDESLVALAEAVTGQLGTMIESRCRDLEVLAGNVEALGELRGPRVDALLERHRQRSRYYSDTRIGDADGAPRTTISGVHRGKSADTVNVQIAAPIVAPNRGLSGYVVGSLELGSFAELVRRTAVRVPGSRVVVLDAGSRVVADSTSERNGGTDRLAAAPLFRSAAPRGLASEPDEHGVPMRAAVEPAGALLAGWRVVAAESQQSIDDNARRLRNETWAAAAVVWLLVFLVGGAVVSRFGRRLSELEAVANERATELASVNARLTLLVNALERADDGIEITDPNARFIYVNPAFERITGYSMGEVVGKTPALLRSGTYDVELYEEIWRRINSGKVYSGAFAGRRKDGTLFDQELAVWPIHGDDGKITQFVGLRRDITARRRTEQALRVSERMASLGTLAAGVAHEINNPLTYVLLNLRFLREHLEELGRDAGGRRERVRLAVDRALEGSERVNAIVKDLRMLSRPNDRSTTALDPRVLLESALRMVGNDLRHRGRLVRHFEPVPEVLANEAQLGQVFLNLLVNAVQALEGRPVAESEIVVRTATDDAGRAVIEIGDTGNGIPPEHLQRIFDPFFTTKPVGLGTGIGLSLCHGTVKALNGEIQVESEIGKGSLFRVLLPAAPSDTFTRAEEAPTASKRRPPQPQKVLVMDDDRAVAEALRQALADHDVTLVSCAEAGLAAVRSARFDTVLCDIMMPGMTGIDFYERLDAGERKKVVFITGGVLTEAARRFLDEAQAPCLEKPVSVEELERALKRTAPKRMPVERGVGPMA